MFATVVGLHFGKAPAAVTADRGYGEAKVDAELNTLGVKRVSIPRKGKPGEARKKVQRGRGFVKMVKWRTGSEARISCLKRDAGWRRTLCHGIDGAQTWCGWGGPVAERREDRQAHRGEATESVTRSTKRVAESHAWPVRRWPTRSTQLARRLSRSRPSLHPARPEGPGTGRKGSWKMRRGTGTAPHRPRTATTGEARTPYANFFGRK